MKKFIIIGAGAVGKTYGLQLQQAGQDVHYLINNEYHSIKNGKNRFKFNFSETSSSIRLDDPNIYQTAEELPKDADFIIISLKTTQNNILKNLLPSLVTHEKCCIIILQNGIGAEEDVQKILPHNPIIAAITTVGAKKTDPGCVDVFILGTLRLAPFEAKDKAICEEIKNMLTESQGIKSKIEIIDNFKQMRWQKLLWNIPFNSLSTLCRVSVATLIKQEPYVSFVRSLMYEIKNIAECDSAIISEETIESMIEGTRTMGEYYPSMYTDLMNGAPIEVKYIITNPLAIAANKNVSTPLLEFLHTHLTSVPILTLPAKDLEAVLNFQKDNKCRLG